MRHINPYDLDVNKAIGLDLPLTSDSISFFKLNYTSLLQAKTNLKNLILTNKGERIMLPDYGCNLRKYVFAQNTEQVTDSIRETILQAVEKWLPHIKITDLKIETNLENEHAIYISVFFALKKNVEEISFINLIITQ